MPPDGERIRDLVPERGQHVRGQVLGTGHGRPTQRQFG
jgi:hypothetical protein